MLKIGLVDDYKKDREYLEKRIYEIGDKFGEEFYIKSFQSGGDICESLKENKYDLIFIDIEMDGFDGIETLKEIKRLGVESYIVFISSFDGRIRELFAEKVIGFISKPAAITQLEKSIKFVLDKVNSKEVFSYKSNGKVNMINLSEIIYFESMMHYVYIHTKKEKISFKGKIGGVWDKLKENYLFGMPHRSYIVNFNYVSFASKTKIQVNNTKDDEFLISIGKTYKDNFNNKFMNFMNRVGSGDEYRI